MRIISGSRNDRARTDRELIFYHIYTMPNMFSNWDDTKKRRVATATALVVTGLLLLLILLTVDYSGDDNKGKIFGTVVVAIVGIVFSYIVPKMEWG